MLYALHLVILYFLVSHLAYIHRQKISPANSNSFIQDIPADVEK